MAYSKEDNLKLAGELEESADKLEGLAAKTEDPKLKVLLETQASGCRSDAKNRRDSASKM